MLKKLCYGKSDEVWTEDPLHSLMHISGFLFFDVHFPLELIEHMCYYIKRTNVRIKKEVMRDAGQDSQRDDPV